MVDFSLWYPKKKVFPMMAMWLLTQWKWKLLSHVQLVATPWTVSPWNSPGQNTGVGNCSLLQGIIPTQGSNLGLSHWRRILYQLSYQGSPRILEWVAVSFSRGFSQPRDRTQVSCIAGGFFTDWTIREAHSKTLQLKSIMTEADSLLPFLMNRQKE